MPFRVFKTTYKDRNGKTKEAAKWYVEFRDQLETVRRMPAFASKAASEEMGRNLVKLVDYHKATGGQCDPALGRWLAGLPQTVREKLVAIGVLNSERAAVNKALADHIDDWAKTLTAKGNSPFHVEVVTGRARRAFATCGFRFYSDISASKFMDAINGMRADSVGAGGKMKRGISAQTFNFYLQAARQFCRWMVRDRRALESPLVHLQGLNVKTDRRRDRRALTVNELVALLDTTHSGPDREGMTGAERFMLYWLAVETGLRSGELRSLTRLSFVLTGESPTVTVDAAYSKHRREDTLPLRPDLAAALQSFVATKMPSVPVFAIPKCRKTAAQMFRADLEAAGLVYRDDAGLVADFHALRHTFISNLARGGVHPKVAQALARHSTISLTMDRYTHTLVEEQSHALDALPDLSAASRQKASATGTDGVKESPSVLASCLARQERFPKTAVGADRLPSGGGLQSRNTENSAVSARFAAFGSVCTSGDGPGLQNQRGV